MFDLTFLCSKITMILTRKCSKNGLKIWNNKNWLYRDQYHVFLRFYVLLVQDRATAGSNIAICRQAQTKLEVCLYMFLWSPDMEAVLVAMSCFRYLCEEADIRCSAEDIPVQSLLPNYNTFMEFASVSNMMITGPSDKLVWMHTFRHAPLVFEICEWCYMFL